jgi:integrase
LVEISTADSTAHTAILLMGDSGLRLGEALALTWTCIDWRKGELVITRNDWRGHVSHPKGGRRRRIPMTARLASALRSHRHLRGERVLTQPGGAPYTEKLLQSLVARWCRKAGVKPGCHILRHSFASHLAMRGCPVRALMALMGHTKVETTQRYMHLSPGSTEAAIRLLEEPVPAWASGEIVETGRKR